MKQQGFKVLEFNQNGDDRGRLVVVEGNSDIPFDIKRYNDPQFLEGRQPLFDVIVNYT